VVAGVDGLLETDDLLRVGPGHPSQRSTPVGQAPHRAQPHRSTVRVPRLPRTNSVACATQVPDLDLVAALKEPGRDPLRDPAVEPCCVAYPTKTHIATSRLPIRRFALVDSCAKEPGDRDRPRSDPRPGAGTLDARAPEQGLHGGGGKGHSAYRGSRLRGARSFSRCSASAKPFPQPRLHHSPGAHDQGPRSWVSARNDLSGITANRREPLVVHRLGGLSVVQTAGRLYSVRQCCREGSCGAGPWDRSAGQVHTLTRPGRVVPFKALGPAREGRGTLLRGRRAGCDGTVRRRDHGR
jgi:hypothetical protein